MTKIRACPAAHELERLALGQLPEAEAEQLGMHILRCSTCAQLLDSLQTAYPFEADLRAVGQFLPVAGADALVERLVRTPTVSADASSAPITETRGAWGDHEPPPERLGRYQIVGRLGAGGMGVVYRAHDPHLGRDVAVKLPNFRGSGESAAAARQRFLREARAAAAVRHAHVCPIYDVGEEQGRPYVVMAFVEGVTLGDRLRRQGRFAESRVAVALVLQVTDALAAIHAAGIVHRDLKSGNILLDRAGQPFLTDFGLARAVDDERLTAVGQLVGTPAYMAPEQASPELGAVGPAADQYSLGVVLYEMLTGRLPFEGSVAALLFQLGTKPVPPPSQFRSDLDPNLESVLLQALARAPQARYPSVADFAVALRAWREQPASPPAQHVCEGQQRRLTLAASSGPTPQVGRDTEAYALYLKARHYWNKRTEDGLRKSIAFFNQALDRESTFALAWAGLADSYHQLGHWGLAPPGTAYPRGKSAALRAIELDDSLTEAQLALAVILKDYDWDFAGAERVFRRALQQKPDHASGHQWYGQCLACMGRHAEAIAELRRAQELDPLALIHDAVLGRHGYFYARQYDQAREQLLKTIQTDPNFWIAQNFVGWVYLFQGDVAAALAAFGRSQELDDNPETLVALGYGHAVAGQQAKARGYLDALTELAPQRYMAPINLALVYTGLGDKDRAFTWLAKACEDHSQWLSEIRVDPAFDPLRSDHRFDTLIKRMNITS